MYRTIFGMCAGCRVGTFSQSLSVFLFGVVCIAAQLTIRRLQFVQVTPGYLVSKNQQGH